MRWGQVSLQGFWCSRTGDHTTLDTRSGPAAARCRADLGPPQYPAVATAGRSGGGPRRLPISCPVARRLAGKSRASCPRRDTAGLAAARSLRAIPAGQVMGDFEPRPLLDHTDPDPARRAAGAYRSVSLVATSELSAGDCGNRRVAARLWGRPDCSVIFGRQLFA